MTRRDAPPPALARACAAWLLACGVVACSPTYDWRESRPPGAALAALFPCRPDSFSRPVTLAAIAVPMQLASCTAGGTTFALAHVELADAAQVMPVLKAMRDAAIGNVGGAVRVLAPLKLPRITPNRLAERLQIDGRRPEGGALHVQAAFFTVGTRVYQASMVGSALDEGAADTFFSGLQPAP